MGSLGEDTLRKLIIKGWMEEGPCVLYYILVLNICSPLLFRLKQHNLGGNVKISQFLFFFQYIQYMSFLIISLLN